MLPYQLIQIIHSYVPIGMMLWFCSWFIPQFDQTERIILFATFVVVPLTLFRIFESASKKPVLFIRVLIFLIPLGALALALSFVLSPGMLAGILAIPWCLVTFVNAALGVGLLVKSSANVGDVSKAIGFIYISAGGIWLVAHQFSLPLLGFEGEIMLLTVNHFHYAGFVAPVLFGFLYDSGHNRFLSRVVVVLGGIAPILIAVGMTYSSIFEWVSVLVFASSLMLYSVLVFIYVIPNSKRWTKIFHILSSGVIWITMALAVTFGYGQWIGHPTIPVSTMILFHGWGNAVLFSFMGLLAWHASLMDQAAARIPFSRIQGKGKIGGKYSTHVSEGVRYMNIAFPLPFSQMTSILNLQHGSEGTLVLTTWQNEQAPGDQGVYVVYNQQAIRMPINEIITVWKEPGSPPGRIEAKHEMWLFGMKVLTLDYHIFRVSQVE